MLSIDGHCDLLSALLESGMDLYLGQEAQITKSRWHLGGPDLLVTAIYVAEKYLPHQKEAKALQMAGIFWQLATQNEFTPILEAKDLDKPGKKALLAIEGGEPISSPEDLHAFYRLGVRMLSFAWNHQNHLATGCLEEYQGGLTKRGLDILATASKLPIILDVSHLSEGSFWSVLEKANNPVIASHSNAYVLHPHPRNLKDEQLKALAEKGGVIAVNFCTEFLAQPTINSVVEQISYLAELIGVEHVGIGSDYLGISKPPSGLEHIGKWLTLEEVLEEKGFNKDECANILGGNLERLFRKTISNSSKRTC